MAEKEAPRRKYSANVAQQILSKRGENINDENGSHEGTQSKEFRKDFKVDVTFKKEKIHNSIFLSF